MKKIGVLVILIIVVCCEIIEEGVVEKPHTEELASIVDRVNWVKVEDQLKKDALTHAVGRDCNKDGKASRQATTTDVVTGTGLEIVTYTNRQGYWHNPVNDYARTFYQDGIPFIWVSYDNQVPTDVVVNGVRYASNIRLLPDGRTREIHKRDGYETTIVEKVRGEDITTWAVYYYYPDGTLQCTGDYDCDLYISGCTY